MIRTYVLQIATRQPVSGTAASAIKSPEKDGQMIEISFEPLPWPPQEACACGEAASWEMWIGEECEALCSECFQLEARKETQTRRDLLGDRIHRTWLVYPWDRVNEMGLF
jgi:hypothetical protein